MFQTSSSPTTPTPSRLDRALSLFTDVRAGEGATALLMLANIFLLLVCYSVVKTVREPLILLGGGAEVRSYAAGGARVIVAPFGENAGVGVGLPDDVRNALSTADATVAAAYSLFTRQSEEETALPAHAEFLIDRDGYLRVRWIGTGESAATRTVEALDRLAILRRETPLPPAPWGHRHR